MKISDSLAKLARPLERQPWRGVMLISALLLALAILQAPDLIAANTSEFTLWLAPWLMWAVCSGIMHGMGFHPASIVGRVLFFPWFTLLTLFVGLWLMRSYFFQ